MKWSMNKVVKEHSLNTGRSSRFVDQNLLLYIALQEGYLHQAGSSSASLTLRMNMTPYVITKGTRQLEGKLEVEGTTNNRPTFFQ